MEVLWGLRNGLRVTAGTCWVSFAGPWDYGDEGDGETTCTRQPSRWEAQTHFIRIAMPRKT